MDKDISFEEAVSKLEEIVKKLESGNISLDESIKIYQEGIILSRVCSKKLEEAEGKILSIVNTEKNESEEFLIPLMDK